MKDEIFVWKGFYGGFADLGSREMVNQTFVPSVQRGPQLTFQETGNQNTFMFAQSNTFIQIDGDMIQTFQLR